MELEQLAGTLGTGKMPFVAEDDAPARDGKRRGKRKGNRGTGRRDLRSLPLEEERIVIDDPHLEALVDAGKVVRHGFEESCKVVTSARLHGLDPEEYLRCLGRLVPLWPAERMLELSPLFWTQTRPRLDPKALAAELGPIAVPATPLDSI